MLVDEVIISNIEKGMVYLETVFNNTDDYEPVLCYYVEGLYKLKNFNRAAEVALSLLDRAKRSKEWKTCIPPSIPKLIAKSYRAKAKEDKKLGNVDQAISSLQKLIEMEISTDNDNRF